MIVRGTGYIRGPKDAAQSRLVAHYRYVEREAATTPDEGPPSLLFDASDDHLTRAEAVRRIMQHATLARVRYHKLVLSPAHNEPVQDWQAWTRAILGDLARSMGLILTWTAIRHTNTKHPHMHVVLAGRGFDAVTGASKPVRLHLPHYEVLRRSALEHSETRWYQHLVQAIMTDPDPHGALLPAEGRVDTYKRLSLSGQRGDRLTPHHIPSAAFIQRYGIKYEQGVTINIEHTDYRGGGRHRLTRTFGGNNQAVQAQQETPREALARDIWDVRRIYTVQGQGEQIRQSLQEVISKNLALYPDIFQKQSRQGGEYKHGNDSRPHAS